MKSNMLNAAAAILAMSGGLPLSEMPARRVRETKEFTHFDQERLDKAEEKRVRKNAKRSQLALTDQE